LTVGNAFTVLLFMISIIILDVINIHNIYIINCNNCFKISITKSIVHQKERNQNNILIITEITPKITDIEINVPKFLKRILKDCHNFQNIQILGFIIY